MVPQTIEPRSCHLLCSKVRGEPVFSVMAAGWFCEKSGWIGKVEDVKPVLLKKKSDFNRQPFWGGGFLLGWIVKHADLIRFDLSRTGYHLVLGFRLSIRCRLVAVWWMANKQNFCFITAFHNFATLETGLLIDAQVLGRLSLQWKTKLASTWKDKYRISASPNSWRQVCSRSNPEKTGRSNSRGKPTASSLSADGFPLMAGPNFQPSDGNPTIISILRQLADGPENVPEM